MILFKNYTSIKNFLYRFTILKLGSLHIRFHLIVDSDKTTLYHNHPFNYISIILKGGYIENILVDGKTVSISHSIFSIIKRNNDVYHRIEELSGRTVTLFITWGKFPWKAINTVSADDEFEDNELMNPSLLMYVFDTLEEAKNVLENGNLKLNIVNHFTAMFVNGEFDKSLIFEIRG